MYAHVDTADPRAVAHEIQRIYLAMFPGADLLFVPRIFGWAKDCFEGKYDEYQAVDARYHDFAHTLEVTLCMARLLHRRHVLRASPILTQADMELGLLAILLHDTGYLKKRDDLEGTGAKYTLIHVDLSGEFARQLLAAKGFPASAGLAVRRMIHCTGVSTNLASIPFPDERERMVGYALGTSDFLGQMAADDYVEKLPELYREFEESARFFAGKINGGLHFSSEEDLLRKTPGFWQHYVLPKLENDFRGLYRFLNNPYPDGPNFYVQKVESNIARLKQIAAQTEVPAVPAA
jgi:hypothetical protein